MKQILRKASALVAAVVCTAALTTSGASFVMADEADEQAISYIESTAKGLTEAIIPLEEAEIESYMSSGDEFTESAMSAWKDAKDELGDIVEVGDAEVEYSDHQYTATVPVDFKKLDADFVYVFDDETMSPISVAVNVDYPLSTTMINAAQNTLMGLGTVFVILIILIFVISLFRFVPGSGAAKKKEKKEAPALAPVQVAAPVVEAVQETDDTELVAVIAAAIAAAEGTTTDGFVVRSIRKINRPRR